jgi:cyclopropane-fatty-acyl-phospholipid synthase
MLLAYLLGQLVRRGNLSMIDADGRRHVFGDGTAPAVTIRLHDRALHRRLFLRPGLAFGEAYMEGTLTVEEGSLFEMLSILMDNLQTAPKGLLTPLLGGIDRMLRRLQQYNPASRAQRNVAHHYDLSGGLYDQFLDDDRQYSCAYFQRPTDDLDTAQFNKKRHIAAKLLLEPGMRVLDIGSGWGGLALYLARTAGVEVTGLTLSIEQQKLATERARAAGLADRVRFLLKDYRAETGRYDRIVSVGMFEHVGVVHYGTFFDSLRDLLEPDGVALLHAIGRRDGPGGTNAWLRKYIFPGGYSPALSEVFPHIERSGLWPTDMEILRLHYALTLAQWRERFERNRAKVAALYDERFCRMWEFYLIGAELSFRVQEMFVFQIQLARSVGAVPITRDYMVDWERAQPSLAASRDSAPAAVA